MSIYACWQNYSNIKHVPLCNYGTLYNSLSAKDILITTIFNYYITLKRYNIKI